jgi:hypothetical protein
MIFVYFKNSKTQKNQTIWCSGWSGTAYGCSKSKFHAAADQAWEPEQALFKLNCFETCISVLSLKVPVTVPIP